MANRPHPCPGRCGATVPVHLLACSPCWWRLPEPLRHAVNLAYPQRKADPVGHRRAVLDAYRWYGDQTAASSTPEEA